MCVEALGLIICYGVILIIKHIVYLECIIEFLYLCDSCYGSMSFLRKCFKDVPTSIYDPTHQSYSSSANTLAKTSD